ncbi:DUF721 domain-containing protein [Nonlabens ponticola]|uniref:DUF721 domain-containing protein n=1 Tax=Nonlabens ponticola TaxID=2496866 RepID=A0A3S9MXY3_9FLAO|nr:DUF721 domain-containing protein [Nonlabens ponticola]AZQ44050.1 DUF721 domain-containing protein [Nonlabens ponticola]
MRNNKKDGFVNMSEALNDFKSQKKLSRGFLKVDINDAWKEVMGPGIESYTTQVKLNGDKLIVSLSSSVLRQELSYGRSKIVTNINEHMGKEVVKTLVLK